jgi:hypothetical protein
MQLYFWIRNPFKRLLTHSPKAPAARARPVCVYAVPAPGRKPFACRLPVDPGFIRKRSQETCELMAERVLGAHDRELGQKTVSRKKRRPYRKPFERRGTLLRVQARQPVCVTYRDANEIMHWADEQSLHAA